MPSGTQGRRQVEDRHDEFGCFRNIQVERSKPGYTGLEFRGESIDIQVAIKGWVGMRSPRGWLGGERSHGPTTQLWEHLKLRASR